MSELFLIKPSSSSSSSSLQLRLIALRLLCARYCNYVIYWSTEQTFFQWLKSKNIMINAFWEGLRPSQTSCSNFYETFCLFTICVYHDNVKFISKVRDWFWLSINHAKENLQPWPAWPDLAKFGHIGKILHVFGECLTIYFLFGKILNQP